jgi:hypothetical protein
MDGAVWLDAATLSNAASWAAHRNAAGANLYFTLNEPSPGLSRKPSKLDIRLLRGIGADIDAKNGRSIEDALGAIGVIARAPSLLIMSGGGWQPLWLFDAPVQATPDAVPRVETVGRKIAALAGGDAVQNIDRIFRLPFTINHPNKKKRAEGRTECLSGLLVQGDKR